MIVSYIAVETRSVSALHIKKYVVNILGEMTELINVIYMKCGME
jgi:hypothetical protein